jgi:hypothetical protein
LKIIIVVSGVQKSAPNLGETNARGVEICPESEACFSEVGIICLKSGARFPEVGIICPESEACFSEVGIVCPESEA